MAIVTVYNRDKTEYGEINTDHYVFNNYDSGAGIAIKVDIKTFPYMKIDGTYYLNDGEYWGYTSGNNTAFLMPRNMGYQTKGSVNKISNITSAKKSTGNLGTNIGYNPVEPKNDRSFMTAIPNYNVGGKGICGSIHTSHNPIKKNFKYGITDKDKETNKKYNGETERDYWSLIPGCPRVIFDTTLDRINPRIGSNNSSITTDGKSEKLFAINKRWPAKDEIVTIGSFDDKFTGDIYPIFSASGSNVANTTDVVYETFDGQKKTILTSTPLNALYSFEKNNNILIIKNLMDNTSTSYPITSEKILIARRPLTSIQKALDNLDKTSYGGGRRFSGIIIPDAWDSNSRGLRYYVVPSTEHWYEESATWEGITQDVFNVTNDYKGVIVSGGLPNTNIEVNKNINKISLNITLPNLIYGDITKLIDKEKIFLCIDNKFRNSKNTVLDPVNNIEPIFKKEIEHTNSNWTKDFKFTQEDFSHSTGIGTDYSASSYCYINTDITYSITISNIVTFSSAINPTSKLIKNFQTANLELYRASYERASASSGSLLQVYHNWLIPSWFEENFLDCWIDFFFGSDNLPFHKKLYALRYLRSWDDTVPLVNDFDYRYLDDDNNIGSYDYATYGVAGWKNWYENGYYSLFPASTSRTKGTSGSPTWVAAKMTYVWYPRGSYITNSGHQIGATVGINLGLDDLDRVDSETYGIPKNTFQPFAIIVCDNYDGESEDSDGESEDSDDGNNSDSSGDSSGGLPSGGIPGYGGGGDIEIKPIQ